MAENDGKVVFELEVDDGKLQAGVNKALAGVQQKVKAASGAVQIGVKADTAAAQKALSGVKGAAETLESSDPSVTVSAQTEGANKLLGETKGKAEALDATDPKVSVEAQTSGANKLIDETQRKAQTLDATDPKVSVEAETEGANKLLGETQGKAETLDGTDPKVSVEAVTEGANKALTDTQGKAETLDSIDPKVAVEAETAGADKLLGETQGKAETLDGTDPKVSVEAETSGANKLLSETQGAAETLDGTDPKVSVEAETAGANKLLLETQGNAETLDGTDPKVSVEAQTEGADKALSDTQGKAETLDGTDPKVSVEAQTESANKALSDTTGAAQTLDSTDPKVTVDADNTAANRQISETQGQADKLGSTTAIAVLDADGTAANQQISDTKSRADALGNTTETVTLDADGSAADQQISGVKGRADALGNTTETTTLDADGTAANQRISDTQGRADALGNTTETVTLNGDNVAANASISYTQAKADALGQTTPTVTMRGNNAAANTSIQDTQTKADALGLTTPVVTITANADAANTVISSVISELNELDGRTVHVNVNGNDGTGGGSGSSGGDSSGSGGGLFGGIMGGISKGLGLVANFAGSAFQAGVSYDAGMHKAMTLMPNMEGGVGGTGVSYDMASNYGKGLLDLSMETGQSIDTLWEATYNALSASQEFGNTDWENGQAGDAMLEYLRTASKLAIGGFTDVDTANTAMAKTINAYGTVTNEETGETQNRYTPEQIADILVKTQNKGITTVGALGQSLSHITGTAASANVGFDQVGAMMATFTAQGVETAEATTKGNALLLELIKGNENVDTALKENGKYERYRDKKSGRINFGAAMKEGITLDEFLLDVKSGIGKSFDKNGGWANVFGSQEAAMAAGFLLNNNGDTYANNLKYMQDDTVDAVGDAYGTMDSSMQQDLAKLSATWQMVLAQIGVAILPIVQELLKVLQSPAFRELLNKIISAITDFIKSPDFMKFVDALSQLLTNFISVLTGGMTWSEFLEPIGIWLGNVIMDALSMLLPIINAFIEAISGTAFAGFKNLDTYQVVTDESGTKHIVPASTVIGGNGGERYDIKRGNNGGQVLVDRNTGAVVNPTQPKDATPEQLEQWYKDVEATNAYKNGYDISTYEFKDYTPPDPNDILKNGYTGAYSLIDADTTGEASGLVYDSEGHATLKQAQKEYKRSTKESADEAEQTAQHGKLLNNGMMRANEATELSAQSAEQGVTNVEKLAQAEAAGAELQKQWFGSSSAGLESATANNEATGEMATANGEAAVAAQENYEVTGEMAGANSAAAGEAVLNAQEAKKEADATGDAANAMQQTSQFTSVAAYAAHRQSDELSRMATGLSNGAAATNAVQSAIDELAARLRHINVPPTGGGGGSFAVGLDYVPYDGFAATLHRGEKVLNRAEAATFRHGGEQTAFIDYNALAAAMSGMSVQMDGRVVGRLVERSVSAAQGERYGRSARNY